MGSLFLAVLFGAIGIGFFSYGRKQKAAVPFLSGIALIILPYLFSSFWALVIVGLILIAIPFYIKL